MSNQRSIFPDGLTRHQSDELSRCADEANSKSPETLLQCARDHLIDARTAYRSNHLINIKLAEAVVSQIEQAVNVWNDLPPHSHSWLKGAVQYFVDSDDDEPDFTSPIGFEDDVEILNACLKLAGKKEWCLNPEDFDDV